MSRRAKGRQPGRGRRQEPRQTGRLSARKKLFIGLGAAAVIVLIVVIAILASRPPATIMATIVTEKGELVLELFARDVPTTVDNFVKLARDGFYDGLTFHRVEPGFVAQGGCPNGDGTGGPGYVFADEFTKHTHVAGALSMANSGANTNGSQFFITYTPQHHLDGKHSVFGQLVEGMDVLESLEPGDIMIRVTIHE